MRKTKEQKRNEKYNKKKIHFTARNKAKHVIDKIKKDSSILTKKFPNCQNISDYFSFCVVRDFVRIPTAKQREKEIIEIIEAERTELSTTVAEGNRDIIFFENELRDHRDNNKGELGILKRP